MLILAVFVLQMKDYLLIFHSRWSAESQEWANYVVQIHFLCKNLLLVRVSGWLHHSDDSVAYRGEPLFRYLLRHISQLRMCNCKLNLFLDRRNALVFINMAYRLMQRCLCVTWCFTRQRCNQETLHYLIGHQDYLKWRVSKAFEHYKMPPLIVFAVNNNKFKSA